MRKISLITIGFGILLTVPAFGQGRNANAITAAQLKDYLRFVAADEMEGRDTPSRGLNTTAKFIATQLSRWGLKPAGDDGSYFQKIALRRNRTDPAQTRAEINGRPFHFGADFLDREQIAGTVGGPVVYAGNGWLIKSKNINPYAGLDVKDKIIVFLTGLPKGVSYGDLLGKEGDDFVPPMMYAARNGAHGAIAIANFQALANWERSRREAVEEGWLVIEKFQQPNGASIPAITASPRMLNALFEGEKESAARIFNRGLGGDAVAPFELSPDKQVSFTIGVKSDQLFTQNVVAVLKGRDAKLKNEYVAIGAHYDHVGIGVSAHHEHGGAGTAAPGDSIYNGADDDGSGTVAVLAMAEAFSRAPRPKRSILFVWHCGEEKGLWGSRYFVDNPVVPLEQIIAQLNIDMIGRSRKEGDASTENAELAGPNEVYVIGSKMMSTELGLLSERANRSYLKLKFNYKYDDSNDPNRFFFRSDHFNYAQKGIPIIFYFNGVHEDYHQPSDSSDKIDYQRMEKIVRTIYATAWELANAKNRPKVDKTLPEELTAN
jgi:Zn-dependent M28 family amino/carboxypeptidase